MAETDKPSVLEARLQAARERRQRQEKERADRKTGEFCHVISKHSLFFLFLIISNIISLQ